MQELIDYNFLIIGRSGSGKSATSKLLTGDPSITVANSLNQVTKQVKFYTGITHSISCKQVRFGILDIPGLDRIDNRFLLRQIILQQLEKLKIVLHGIIYIASLTQRDTVDQTKLFNFIDQLPWQTQTKKACLIPILTKYDNFVFDSPQQDIQRTKQQFHKLFQSRGYSTAWTKRIYWVNFTKSLDCKIKMIQDIRQKYEGQLQRLYQMLKKNKKTTLNAQSIKQYIKQEQKYVMEHLLRKFTDNDVPYTLTSKTYRVPLHIKIQPSKVTESLTAVSASSIGLFIARVFKHDIPFPISLVMMGIPITLTFVNLIATGGQNTAEKIQGREDVGCRVISNFGSICQRINEQLEQQWKLLNKDIQFSVDDKYLHCKLTKNINYKFFSLQRIQIKEQSTQVPFGQVFKKKNENRQTFSMVIPQINADGTWDPLINFKYEVKVFEQATIMNIIQHLRSQFNHI